MSSIVKAVSRAYMTMRERNWDTIYWAIDLHGTCLKSNYENGGYEFINEDAKKALQMISALQESSIILWSSVYPSVQTEVINFFYENGIRVDAFNSNPFEKNTKTGHFQEKFYFSVLLDDKAGFDPDIDWLKIIFYLQRAYDSIQSNN